MKNQIKKNLLIKITKMGDKYFGYVEDLNMKTKFNFKNLEEINILIKEILEKGDEK
ncbi:MAG: hypothetical protein QMD25_00380 [Caldisericia bacterium]|jgi:hypothetical protein|nr:hypothetical protein [Caldisericia bacterium]